MGHPPDTDINSWGEQYNIDAWGNLTSRSAVSGKQNTEPLSCGSANAKNQLNACFTYDIGGNLIQNGSTTYIYDAENRLVWSSNGYEYIYDGDGERVIRCTSSSQSNTCPSGSTGTLYWRPLGGDTIAESSISGTNLEEYVFFNGRRVARRDVSTNAVHYYFSDHLGSHSVVENATGSACEQDTDYYPYGGQEHDFCTTPVPQNYKFNGKERDTESGLDNFGARYDASNLGRFMTPDWAAKPIAVPYANFGNPQSLNLYSYVENNPTTFGDPDGHQGATGNGDFSQLGHLDGSCSSNPTDCLAQMQAAAGATVAQSTSAAKEGQDQVNAQAQNLSDKSEKAILKSNLTGEQAIAFENAVLSAGKEKGVDPNILVGLAQRESNLNPDAVNGTAKGLYQIMPGRQKDLGLSNQDLNNIGKVVSAVAGSLAGAIKTFNGDSKLAIASWTLGVGGTRHLFSSGGMEGVRNALLDRGHPEYGRVGPNYIDPVSSFQMQ